MPEPRPLLPETIDPNPAELSEQPTVPPQAVGNLTPTLLPRDPNATHPPPPEDGGESAELLLGDGVPAIPGYEILGKLGEGGMGVVYKARHLGLNRLVALKMIRIGLATEDLLQRFQGEAKAVAKLQHPNIVQIYDIGRHGGCPYIALEYVAGGSLDRRLNGTPQPPQAAAELVETLARAMHVAHLADIVHRDLKPANVLIQEDSNADYADYRREGPSSSLRQSAKSALKFFPKITDFGLAKQLDADCGQTRPEAVMGTPSYMAPEQAGKNKTVGPPADVYALGAILYELLTGRPPFKAATPLETVLQVVSDEPVPPRQLQSKVPRDLETICLKCLQKEAAKRYEAARGLADDLHRFVNGEPIHARPVGQAERFGRWCRRNPVVAGLAGAVAAVLIIAIAISMGLSVWALDERSQAKTNEDLAKTNENLANQRAGELKTANTSLDGALQLAKTNEKRADDRADEALAAVEQFQVANGLRELGSGQLYQALRWFALPLSGEGTNTPRAEMYRDRLSNYWRLPQDVTATRHVLAQSLQHQSGVVHSAFSPDGRRVLTASWDNTARVWDAATGQPTGPPLQHQDLVTHAAFSPDGRYVVTASWDSTARVWDAATGQPAGPPLQHRGVVNHAAFSADGRRVVTASHDQTARVWDAATGLPVGPPLQNQESVTHAAISPDGRRIVTAGWFSTARLWDAATGLSVGPPLQHQNSVPHAAFSPDGRYIVTASHDDTARVWDAATGLPAGTLIGHKGAINYAAFSPDGRRIVTASGDKTARVWDVASAQPAGPALAHENEVLHAAFSPDGRRVVTASLDATARVWDAATGQPTGPPLQHQRSYTQGIIIGERPAAVNYAAFSPDGRRVVTASSDGTARVWDAATGRHAGPLLQHQRSLYHVAFSPDGRRVITASSDKTARLWDAVTGQPAGPPLHHQESLNHVAFSPDGRRVITASEDKTARVWDATTGQPVGPPLQHQAGVGRSAFFGALEPHGVPHAAFSPDGLRVVTASCDKTARVWDAATGQPSGPPLSHQERVWHAAFSPDGRRVVTASDDKTARVWDAATGLPAASPFQHQGRVTHAAFSPDGRRVVTASWDKTAQVWDAATGQPAGPPVQHQGVVNRAAFSPDGRRVVTASGDKTARVWDAATGQPVGPPLQHQDRVVHAEFSPDGRRVVTASDDKTARVWDATTGQPAGPPFQHQGRLTHAAFSPDGRRVVTSSVDKTARVWNVSTDDRPAKDWVRLTQFFPGKLDRFGAHESLSPKEMEESWNYLRTKYPQDFTVTPAQARAWHRREAEACEKEQNPAAALLHILYGCDLNWALPWGLGRP